MKKTILVSLAGLVLFLVGCTQQTPINTGASGNIEYGGNFITILSGIVTQQDFKFFKCTTY